MGRIVSGKPLTQGPAITVVPTQTTILVVLALAAFQLHAQDLTTLASFNGSNGLEPLAGLTVVGNRLHGTAVYGGSGYNGTHSAATARSSASR